MAIFRDLTPLVEPISLDEAFLDVTGRLKPYGGGRGLAQWLKREVKRKTGLTVSIGVGTNKTVAKIASDMGKPDGLVLVPPGTEAEFLAPLPVRRLSGVGPKSEQALRDAGFQTVGQVAEAPPSLLEALFGSRGAMLREMARGEDGRPVEPEQERKSVGAETTFPRDLADGPELRAELQRVVRDVAERLQRSRARSRTIAIKLRYADFTTITRQASRPQPTDDPAEILAAANGLLDKVVQDGDRFRLLGVQCSNLAEEETQVAGQMPLWRETAGR